MIIQEIIVRTIWVYNTVGGADLLLLHVLHATQRIDAEIPRSILIIFDFVESQRAKSAFKVEVRHYRTISDLQAYLINEHREHSIYGTEFEPMISCSNE